MTSVADTDARNRKGVNEMKEKRGKGKREKGGAQRQRITRDGEPQSAEISIRRAHLKTTLSEILIIALAANSGRRLTAARQFPPLRPGLHRHFLSHLPRLTMRTRRLTAAGAGREEGKRGGRRMSSSSSSTRHRHVTPSSSSSSFSLILIPPPVSLGCAWHGDNMLISLRPTADD